MPIRAVILASLAMALSWPGLAFGDDLVKATLIADTSAIQAGRTFRLGVLFRLAPDWHIYWKNPGDSGVATSVEFVLPEGFVPGPLHWPAPRRIVDSSEVVNFGYTGEVLLWSEVKAPDSLSAEGVDLRAKTDWLVCKDSCVPGAAEVSLTLKVAHAGASDHRALFDRFAAEEPVSADAPGSPFKVTCSKSWDQSNKRWKLKFRVSPTSPTTSGDQVEMFHGPVEGWTVGRAVLTRNGADLTGEIELHPVKGASQPAERLQVVIALRAATGRVTAVSLEAPLQPPRTDGH